VPIIFVTLSKIDAVVAAEYWGNIGRISNLSILFVLLFFNLKVSIYIMKRKNNGNIYDDVYKFINRIFSFPYNTLWVFKNTKLFRRILFYS
jgi:hypothetical protein